MSYLIHGLVYIRAQVQMKSAGEGIVRYGADGPVKVWVNNESIGCAPGATNPAKPEAYRAPARWKAGSKTLTMALCTNHGMAWGIFATAAWD